MTLYEITEEFRALTETWDDTITDDEFMTRMDALNDNFDAKIKNCAFFVKNLLADVPAIDAEIKRLQDRKKAITNKADRMKTYMRDNMIELQRTAFDFDVITVKVQNNPPKVVVNDEGLIPDKYKTEETVIKIDKKAIRDDGGCNGVDVIQEQGVRIR